MKKIRNGLIVLAMLLTSFASAEAQLSIGIGLPNVSIGINLPLYPELAPVPGYPVYYAPQVNGNYFFYDGMYWVYQDDNWYASSWYNGPWGYVEPTVVPLFVLRIPVRYYRQPPSYFRGWHANAPPRWGQHWGHSWEQQRHGWDKWNRRSVPARAPQPVYQKRYSGDRYPQAEQQHAVRNQQYRYQPRDKAVRQHFNQQGGQGRPAPAQRGRQEAPQMNNQRQQAPERSPQHQQGAPAAQQQRQQPGAQQHQQPGAQQRQQPGVQQHQQGAPAAQQQRQQPGAQQHQQQPPKGHQQEQRQQERGKVQEPDRDQGQGHNKDADRGHGNKDEDRGHGRDK